MEQLEARLFLSTGSILPLTSPSWFADYSDADTPSHVNSPTLAAEVASSNSDVWEAEGHQYDWIVRFHTAAVQGLASVAQTSSLLVGAGLEFEVIRGLGLVGQAMVRSNGASLLDVQSWLQTNSNVAAYELDGAYQLQATPDDSGYSELWGLKNSGQLVAGQYRGTPGADIDAEAAWDISTGSNSIVVGVIDTGVDYSHPDLAANIWTNPGEIAGNGIDDDGNGFVDDVHGYDFVNNDGDPMDDNSHGTHVAGTIAGRSNNGQGVAGVNWSSSIMGLKFLSAGGSGSLSDAVRAINYATMMRTGYGVNIRVTNNSWGGGGYSSSMYDAIQAHNNAGILFVAAAGNTNNNNDVSPSYPASYELPGILAVAATDYNDNLASFSSYGASSVDLAAPGVTVYSTVPGGGYAWKSGTSMATPHVAGVAALAWSVAPDASLSEVRTAILQGSDSLGSLSGRVATGGRLNALGTLQLLDDPEPQVPSISGLSASPNPVVQGAGITLTAQQVSDSDGSIVAVNFVRDTNRSGAFDQQDQFLGSDLDVTNGGNATLTVSTAGLAAGSHTFFALAKDSDSQWSPAAKTTLTVTAADLHGNNPAEATLIGVGWTDGEIQTSSDVDWFKFSAVAGTTYQVDTELGTLADSMLFLYDQDGSTVLANSDDVDWPADPSSRITWQAPATGTYYLEVTNYRTETGSYRLALQANTPEPPPATDLGTVDFREIAGLDLTAGDAWYVLQTAHQGTLTIAALFEASSGSAGVTLYDANRDPLVPAPDSTANQRIDWQVGSGQTYYFRAAGDVSNVDLRLANLVHQSGTSVQVHDTGGNDQFRFTAGSVHQITINGVSYQFQSSQVSGFVFSAAGGEDTAVVTGSAAADSVWMDPTSTGILGPGYRVRVTNTAVTVVHGGGGFDRAFLSDSAGDDTFVGTSTFGRLSGSGFSNLAMDFGGVYAYAVAGGFDRAFLSDSAGDDTYFGIPTFGRLSGSGFSNLALGFDSVYANATAGGSDRAFLSDSAGDDTFLGTSTFSRLFGSGFSHLVMGFSGVYAHATAGGNDIAQLHGSGGDDTFVGTPTFGRFSGSGFSNLALGFDNVYANATAGGTDRAHLYDSAADDTFLGTPEFGRLAGNGFSNLVLGFDGVSAYATAGGTDRAYLYDSAGDDTFLGTPVFGKLSGSGFSNLVLGFDRVSANAAAGGTDRAYLYDSPRDDTFVGSSIYARFRGSGFYNEATSFDYVYAYSTSGGSDTKSVTAIDYVLETYGTFWSNGS